MNTGRSWLPGSLLISVFVLATIAPSVSPAQNVTLIPKSSTWRWRKGTNEVSNPTTAWRQPSFNDAAWLKGSMPLYYGYSPTSGTLVTGMQSSFTTIFLRSTFVVANPALVNSLTLTEEIDDGFIVWINGVEVQRYNVFSGEQPCDATTPNNIRTPFAEVATNLSNVASILVAGTNVIAVHLVNRSLSSTDLYLDLQLTASLLSPPEPPTITGTTPARDATVGTLTQITVTFSEPVMGVDASDLELGGQPASALNGVPGTNTYAFSFTQPPPGLVGITWNDSHGIVDLSGEPFDPAAPGATWSYTLLDNVPPAVSQVIPVAGAQVSRLEQIEATFSEPVLGVNASDLLINGLAATSVTGAGIGPYVFKFPQPTGGTVQLAWAGGHGITDAAANPNPFSGGNWTVTLNPGASSGDVVINEFLAASLSGLTDEDGEVQDWIELYNRGTTAVSLLGWSLTDDQDAPGKWTFPARQLNPGEYLIVFASAKDRRAPTGGNRYHTNFKLNGFGDYLGLFNAESPRVPASEFEPKFPEQRNNYSYGLVATNEWRYFQTPTPGGPNGSSVITGVVSPPHFSVGHGLFDAPFDLVLTVPLPGATIRYTTDGTEPTAVNGQDYIGPIHIAQTTVLRAAAFQSGLLPSTTVTHSFLFLDQVLQQPNTPPGYPSTWGTFGTFTAPGDYEMDPEIVNDPVYGPQLLAALRSLPAVSVAMSEDDLFGPANGIYTHPEASPRELWERPCSVEFIPTNGAGGFQVNCGIRIQGNASRTPIKTPKHPFRLFFKGDYGPGRLEYEVFPDSSLTSFNTLVLRADFNNSWLHWDTNQRRRGTRIRDGWVKETWRDMARPGGHTRYCHLFLNGLYWGVYDLGERIDAALAANYYGGEPEEYDAIAAKPTEAIDGDLVAYNAMLAVVRNNDMSVLANYSMAQQRLDMPTFIDYMLLNFYGGNEDWGADSNWNAVRRRTPGGTFRYLPWDGEQLITTVSYNRVSNTDVPSGLHTRLINSPEYRLAFADRVHKHLFNNGALSVNANTSRWLKHAAQLDSAVIAESARWGDYRRDVHPYSSAPYEFYTRDAFWLPEVNRLVNDYFPQRGDIVLQQLKNAGLYPNVTAPSFNRHGGPVAAGFLLTISTPAGTIYYTTNGVDPRTYGSGAVSPDASRYVGSIRLETSVAVKARVLSGVIWSALNEASFTVGQLGVPLRITEINYNPVGGDPYEFIEFQNLGTLPVDASQFSLQGVDYIFVDGSIIAPGAVLVLGSSANTNAFALRYPAVPVFGTFSGNLSNGGERLAILDRNGQTVTAVHYDDEDGWPAAADGGGYSLEIIDPWGDPNAPANWRASLQASGTPGLPPAAAPALGDIVLNEVMAENLSTITNVGALPDWIELHNRGESATNLVGWSLSDDSEPRKFVFPANTQLAAGGYLVVWCDNATNAPGLHTGFALGRSGDNVFLHDGNTNRVDALTFGLQIADRSVGRIADTWQLNQPTPGSNNVAVTMAPATDLSLNEWLANPAPGGDDWVELFNRSTTAPVALQGLYVGTSNALCRMQALSFLAPRGHTQLFADEKAGADHLEFKLPATSGTVTLHSDAAVLLDQVSYGAQTEAVSQGRLPDGAVSLSLFNGSVSPGASNYVLAYFGPVLNEVLARNQRAVVTPWGNYADFIELFNPASTNVNLDGMALGDSLDGKGRRTFPAGTTIGAGGYLRVWCDGGRAPSATTGNALNTGFSLAGESGDVVLFNALGQPVDWVKYGFQVQDLSIGRSGGAWQLLASPTPGTANDGPAELGAATDLRINEWLAAGDGDDWFELYNTSPWPVDLGGLFLTDDPSSLGITNMPIAPLSFIGGQDWVKWIADGNRSAGRDHANFALEQLGETIRLYAADRTLLDAVDFGVQTTNVSQGRLPDGAATIVSFATTPTPGDANYLPLTNVIINEVLAHTDAPLEDAVELFNPTASDVPIGGWYLSDSQSDLKRYRIPDGTSIPAGGYRVFYQGDFGPADGETDTPPLFTFNSAHGDAVYLSEADAGGNLTGYRIGQAFDASTNAASFGRYATSVGVDFVTLSHATFGVDHPANVADFRTGTGASNAYPRVGPIVLNEIMYHPAQGTNTTENPDEEYIELHNLTGASVPLRDPAHPTNTWRLASAVTFDFPDLSIPAGGYLVVVPFDPATNAAALTAFEARYGNQGWLVGPYSGRLNNAGDAIELWRPDAPQAPPRADAGYVPYFLVDRVVYSDLTPWPTAADGGGASLQRLVPTEYGNDPVNWKADGPTVGRTNTPSAGEPPIVLVPPQSRTNITGSSVEFTVTADGTAPLSYQWLFNNSPLAGRTDTSLQLNDVQASDAGDYRVVVTNAFGNILSAPATLTVWAPPAISAPPQSQTVNVGSNVAFHVTASGTAPLRYQWQRNSGNLPGRTDDVLALGAVGPLEAGAYRVIVTNVAGVATSALAMLTVQSPPVITGQPRGGFAAIGSRVTLSASATGDAPLSYQWRLNGAVLAGATNPTLTLEPAQAADSGTYTLGVTNHAGWAVSDPAVLTVVEAPALLSPELTPEGGLVSFLVGPTNHIYAIEASTNLVDWLELGTLNHTNAQTPFLDPEPSDVGRCYYRARLVE